jgi:hypothetical protein
MSCQCARQQTGRVAREERTVHDRAEIGAQPQKRRGIGVNVQ